MATVKIGSIKGIKAKLRREITRQLRSRDSRDVVGRTIVDGIKDTTLAIATSEATLAFRKYYEKANATDKKYDRTLIKAVFTGELLEDLVKNTKLKTSDGNISYLVEHSDKLHKKYKKPAVKRKRKKKGAVSKRQTYKTIQGYLSDLGYKYLDVSKSTGQKLIKKLREAVEKAVVKFNKL